MYRPGIVFGIGLGLALWCAGCAPVDDRPNPDPGPNGETISRPKPLPVVPGALKDQVREALEVVSNRDLLTRHAFWTVFHGILGNGLDAKIRDLDTNKEYNAVDYIRHGGYIKGMDFIVHEKIADGKDGIDVRIGPTFEGQGHQDQFVAEMAQLGLPLDTEFSIRYRAEKSPRRYTFADFIRYSMANTEIGPGIELSWTMLAIARYYGTAATWKNKRDTPIQFEQLVAHEVREPIETAACGGTHRLFGLTWVYNQHLREGGKLTPVWQEVAAKLKKYRDKAFNDQNRDDGSFSTDYFRSKSAWGDLDKKIGTTGHIVEWLSLYLPDDELRAEWMQAAVRQLVRLIAESRNELLDGGSIYHAAHGLHLYYYRVWGDEHTHPCARVIPLPPHA